MRTCECVAVHTCQRNFAFEQVFCVIACLTCVAANAEVLGVVLRESHLTCQLGLACKLTVNVDTHDRCFNIESLNHEGYVVVCVLDHGIVVSVSRCIAAAEVTLALDNLTRLNAHAACLLRTENSGQ